MLAIVVFSCFLGEKILSDFFSDLEKVKEKKIGKVSIVWLWSMFWVINGVSNIWVIHWIYLRVFVNLKQFFSLESIEKIKRREIN